MKMFLDKRTSYNNFKACVNGEYLLDSTGSNDKRVIWFYEPAKVIVLIVKTQLHDKIFNEIEPARFVIELAFGSSNKKYFSDTRPLTLAPLGGGAKGPLWFFANSSWNTGNFALKLAIPLRATIPHLVS